MSKKCECGKELLTEWKFCPECGCDLQQNTESSLSRAEEMYLFSKALLEEWNTTDLEFVKKILSPKRNENKSDIIDCMNKRQIVEQKVFKYCKKSAELKNKEAKILLARCYQRGIGTEWNYKEAIDILKPYAEQGNVTAQIALGAMYFRGDGRLIEQNLDESVKWYKLAAEQGDSFALGVLEREFNIKI